MTLTKLIELQGDSYRDYINSGKAPDFLDFVMDFDFAALDEKIKRYEEALRKIEKWHGEFPDTGKLWENTDGTISDRPMSYGACNGSNGERDYMRNVAAKALEGME